MPRWTPTALLIPVHSIQAKIDLSYQATRQHLQTLFPEARVQHVGSSALAPALTRGTIDIDLMVPESEVADAEARVDAGIRPSLLPCSVAVHPLGQPSPRLRVRQTFAENALLLGEFISMQKKHVHVVGPSYARAKADFFTSLESRQEYANADLANAFPYRIELETERLTLESALVSDAREIAAFRLANRSHLEATGGARPDSHYSVAHLEESLAGDPIKRWCKHSLNLLVRLKSDRSLIGICNFSSFVWGAFRSCNLGYVVAKQSEGKGYMSEACALALDYVQSEWRVHRVQAVYDSNNTRSAALAERLGLRVVGTAKDYICLDGRWRDGVIASLVR